MNTIFSSDLKILQIHFKGHFIIGVFYRVLKCPGFFVIFFNQTSPIRIFNYFYLLIIQRNF